MNTWLKSMGIGLLAALIGYFLMQLKLKEQSVNLFDVDVTIKTIPYSKNISYRYIFENLEKRLASANYNYEIKIVSGKIISISLKNIKDTVSIKKMLTSNGRIQFRELFNVTDLVPALSAANELIIKSYPPPKIVPKVAPKRDSMSKAVSDLLDSIEINETANNFSKQPRIIEFLHITQEGSDPGMQEPAIGRVKLKDTSEVRKIFESPEVKKLSPSNLEFYYGAENSYSKKEQVFLLYPLIKNGNGDKAFIENDDIKYARQDFDPQGRVEVFLEFTRYGSTKWSSFTRKNTGKATAIVFDNNVISAPRVLSEINEGNAVLSGSYTMEEAGNMAAILNGKAIPANLNIVSFATNSSTPKHQTKMYLISALIFLLFTGIGFFLFKMLKSS